MVQAKNWAMQFDMLGHGNLGGSGDDLGGYTLKTTWLLKSNCKKNVCYFILS